jgi:hypothetical protein
MTAPLHACENCAALAEQMRVLLQGLEHGKVWGDKPLAEDAAIDAVFPTRSNRHDLYAEALRLVSARHSKGGLVDLVNWLLHRIDAANADERPTGQSIVDEATSAIDDLRKATGNAPMRSTMTDKQRRDVESFLNAIDDGEKVGP